MFQHIANFYNYNLLISSLRETSSAYSYCCRLPGLRLKAFPNKSGSPSHLTFRHWAGLSLYTSSYEFAQTCVFVKQSLRGLFLRPRHYAGTGHIANLRPANLPNSLRKVLSLTLVFPTSPPVSVIGTIWCQSRYDAFLGDTRLDKLPSAFALDSSLSLAVAPEDFPSGTNLRLKRGVISSLASSHLVPP